MTEKPTYKELEKRIQELEQVEFRLRQNEEKLVHSRELMDYIISHARSAIAVHDRDLKYIYASKRYLEEYKVKGRDVIGKHHYEIFPDLPQKWRDVHQRSLAGEVLSAEEDPYYREDGSVDWTCWECRPWYESNGSIGGIIVYTEVINERKKAEESLKNSRLQFEAVLNNLDSSIYITDMKTNEILFMNQNMKNEFGRDLTGEICWQVIHKNLDGPCEFCSNDKLLDTKGIPKKPYVWEIYNQNLQHWYELRDQAIPWLDGRLVRMEIATKITDRKKAENDLKESEERFRQIYEYQGVGVAKVSLEFHIESANKAYCNMLGYREEELIGKHLSDITHPEILEENLRKQLDLVRGKMDSYRLEKRFFHKNGAVVYGILSASLVRDSEGKPLYFLGSVVDITKRKQTAEALRESEEKYRSMMESMRDAAYICSSELRIEYMNSAMINRIGRDATGENCHKAIYNLDEKCPWCVFDHIQKGDSIDYEVADPKDDRYYSVTNAAISDSGGSTSKLTIFHDITEIKKAEENLRQAQKMESIGTLTGGIAHDFNNLLYMIIGNTELALEDVPEWNPAYTNLEDIKTASLRAAAIVKQLLSFSRKGGQELKPIGVVAVIKDSLKFLRSTIPTTIEIQAQFLDDDIVILADSTQINQVMMNLCINASQAMEKTGGVLEICAEKTNCEAEDLKKFPDLAPGNYLKITVRDTGPGIRSEIVNQIFDPYYTTKEMGKGSGMGLSIVHGIIQNHGGAILVDSSPGKGTTFILLFPIVEEKPVNEAETDNGYPSGTETILFVDDEQVITDMNQKVLEKLGYRVEASLNPVEALDLFQSQPDTFDLVITDMTMPQMTGAKLSEKLREIKPDIPVIMCTGHSSLIDEKKARQLGISGYIMKPASISTIAKAIRNVLDK